MRRPFSRRRERMQKQIFLGIYEDNLALLGKTSPRMRATARFPAALKAALFLTTFAGTSFFPGASFAPQRLHEQETQARVRTPLGSPAADAGSTAPASASFPDVDPALFQGGKGLTLRRQLGLRVRTILIDPGHGGEDTGAIGLAGTREKEMTLDIARRLKRRLQERGRAEVLLTRDADRTLALTERVAIAAAMHADLFVSVHLNFLPRKPINIIETFYFGPATDAAAAESARRENGREGPGMSELREIIERMGTRLRLEESRRLAAAIQSSLYRNSRRQDAAVLDRGIKRGPFVVLNRAEVPAVLAEVSCLSNAEEEARLGGERHREDIAAYLESGILDYLTSGEGVRESKKQ